LSHTDGQARPAETVPDLRGVRVCVAGLGVTGVSAARVLAARGARVVAVGGRDNDRERAAADELRGLGVDVVEGKAEVVPPGTQLVVTSPGLRPDDAMLVAAAGAGIPVWGDVELAFRLRPAGQRWLGVTGTNGKTTAVQMLASILEAGGVRAIAAGNVGYPILDAVLADPAYDVLAVELSSFQLHWTSTVEFTAAAILNVAPDHLDWHGSMQAYSQDKAAIWRGSPVAVYNADDPASSELAAGRERTVGFTLARPGTGRFGVSDGALVDGDGTVLAEVADVRPAAPHNVANALAAAALAGSVGVGPTAVRDGLRAFSPGAHRITRVRSLSGVDYVDDSKATNPHAAAASLQAFDRVVWVAGGLAKGARFEDVVASVADRLRGVVLMGRDRALLAEALARHAPQIPVVEVSRTDTGAMDDVVRAAAGLAEPGDTVLLAPACASMDMFADYAARGDAFAEAVRRLGS
jgi:UDP-N-acetylmuramoylalanine--D-glutamate ligase